MIGYEIVTFIGEGRYSSIFEVRNLADGKKYILKKLKINCDDEQIKKVYKKFQKISTIDHPNIIKYYDIAYDEKAKTFSMLMELADKGDLQSKLNGYLHLRKFIEEEQIWVIFFQLLKALKSLHQLNILHRDLKLSNIFLSSEGVIKVGDINIIEELEYANSTVPVNYLSPELWDSSPYSDKCDIWSLGCVIYEICNLKPAFRGENLEELKKKINRGYYPPLSSEYSPDLSLLMKHLLNVDPTKRPSAKQILELEFVIKNFNNLILRNLLNEGVRLSDFKNIYVNNPFGPKDEKNKTKRKLSKSRKDKKIATLPDSKHLMKRNISNISENTNLHLTNDIKLKAKSEYLNQTLRKMKESLERINQRKQEAKVTTSIDLKPITSNHNHLIPFFSENPTTKSFKYIKKQKKNKEKKTIDLTKLTQKVNESHYKDLNIETKFPIIEKSRILMNSANEKLFDPDLTERTSGLGTHDKKFITRNLSYNQFMMNKKKEESKMIFENKIISLKEIHKKYVNLT